MLPIALHVLEVVHSRRSQGLKASVNQTLTSEMVPQYPHLYAHLRPYRTLIPMWDPYRAYTNADRYVSQFTDVLIVRPMINLPRLHGCGSRPTLCACVESCLFRPKQAGPVSCGLTTLCHYEDDLRRPPLLSWFGTGTVWVQAVAELQAGPIYVWIDMRSYMSRN